MRCCDSVCVKCLTDNSGDSDADEVMLHVCDFADESFVAIISRHCARRHSAAVSITSCQQHDSGCSDTASCCTCQSAVPRPRHQILVRLAILCNIMRI